MVRDVGHCWTGVNSARTSPQRYSGGFIRVVTLPKKPNLQQLPGDSSPKLFPAPYELFKIESLHGSFYSEKYDVLWVTINRALLLALATKCVNAIGCHLQNQIERVTRGSSDFQWAKCPKNHKILFIAIHCTLWKQLIKMSRLIIIKTTIPRSIAMINFRVVCLQLCVKNHQSSFLAFFFAILCGVTGRYWMY